MPSFQVLSLTYKGNQDNGFGMLNGWFWYVLVWPNFCVFIFMHIRRITYTDDNTEKLFGCQ